MPAQQTKKTPHLTEDQRSTVTHGLRVAAERFEADAATLRADTHPQPFSRLATQFDRQAADTRALADLIENAEYIELGPEVE